MGKCVCVLMAQDLNKAILREQYPLKTIEDVILEIPEAKTFTKLDATSGYWQVLLDDESKQLCTFNTPYGRYSFRRLPFGIKSASEVYQRTISEIMAVIPGCDAIVDDILIWGRIREEHDATLKKVLDRCRMNNLKLNEDKSEFRKSSVTYAGHVLSDKGVKPDAEKCRAIKQMEEPKDLSELQTFMGLVQYLGKFIPNLSEVTAPLRQLLGNDVIWHWEAEQQQSFE